MASQEKISTSFSETSKQLLEKACEGIRLEESEIFEDVINFIISGKKFIFHKRKSAMNEISPPGIIKYAIQIVKLVPNYKDYFSPREVDINDLYRLEEESESALCDFLQTNEGNNPDILRRLAIISYICQQEDSLYIDETSEGINREESIKEWFDELLKILDRNTDISSLDIEDLIKLAQNYQLSNDYIFELILEDHYRHDYLKMFVIKNTNWKLFIEDTNFISIIKNLSEDAVTKLASILAGKNYTLSKTSIPNIFELVNSKASLPEKLALIKLTPSGEAANWLHEKYLKSTKKIELATIIYWLGSLENGQYYLENLTLKKSDKKLEKIKERQLEAISHKNEIKNILTTSPSYELPLFSEEIPDSWLKLLKESTLHQIEFLTHLDKFSKDKTHERDIENYKTISDDNLKEIINFLCTGEAIEKQKTYKYIISESEILETPEAHLIHWLRFKLFIEGENTNHIDYIEHIFHKESIISKLEDLRQIADIFKEFNINPVSLLIPLLESGRYWKKDSLPESLDKLYCWPFLAQHHEIIDSILDKEIPVGFRDDVEISECQYLTILALNYFPMLPKKWTTALYNFSITGSQKRQSAARQVLEKNGIERERIYAYLHSNKKEERLNAINWLSDLHSKVDLPTLISTLENESDNQVKARLLQTIDSLGGDISSFLTPEKLLMEAEQGLSKKVPSTMAWFRERELPQLFYRNHQEIPNSVIYWWAVLAVKLKEVDNSLIKLHTSLLHSDSQALLSEHVLTKFLAIETGQWAKEEAETQTEFYYDELPTSAIKEKGLLTLISHDYLPSTLPKIASFIKQYPLKRAQAEAFLSILSTSNDPSVMQFIITIATTHKTKSVRQCAVSLVDQIAERNNWTADQLADRSVPTLDLEHVYKPTPFSYGQREFSMLLNDKLELVVFNPAGKPVKSLPAALAGEDWSPIRERKSWLSAHKKSLKSIVQQRKIRFKHAMVFAKQWSVAEWCEHLHQHPVQNRMVQRLIWQVSINDNWISFRPLEDGTFSDIHDEDITLPENGQIRLLSANLISAEEIAHWHTHLQDFQVEPLIDQLTVPMTQANFDGNKIPFSSSLTIEASALRKYMLNIGYKRGETISAIWYNQYIRTIESEGFGVVMEFSGNEMGDFEMGDVSLDCLQVYRLAAGKEVRDWHGPLALKEVPENMLHHLLIECDHICQQCSEK